MATKPDIYWTGFSGVNYGYWIHRIGTEFKAEAGNYLYAKQTSPGYWVPIYIGETDDLGRRLSSHEKEAAAKLRGATHVHGHTTPRGVKARQAEEEDLIKNYNPPLNTEYSLFR